MATSRVGGTKGLLTGSVGSDTYYVQNDGNGNITQIVQQKKTAHTNTKTVRLAVQQMCTAIIEAMMRDLKPLIKISFQSAKNKTSSCNMFSQYNLRLLAQDVRQHWYDSGEFYYPQRRFFSPVAGPFTLSCGSLPFNAFAGVGTPETWDRQVNILPRPGWAFGHSGVCVWFKCPAYLQTIGQFMKYNRLSYSSVICAAGFYDFIDTDNDKTQSGYIYAIISINPMVSSNSPISEDSLSSLFIITASWPITFHFLDLNRDVVVGAMRKDDFKLYTIFSYAAFTRDYYNGRLLISDSQFLTAPESSWPYELGSTPASSLWSWLNLEFPQKIDYPW